MTAQEKIDSILHNRGLLRRNEITKHQLRQAIDHHREARARDERLNANAQRALELIERDSQ